MKIFPAQYSTLAAEPLKDELSNSYGIPLTKCSLLVKNVSDTYVLEDEYEVKYIFKIYRKDYRSLSQIKGEAEMLDLLYHRGIPVAYPIADCSHEFIQSFQAAEGTRYGILFSYAIGVVVQTPDARQLKVIGNEIAAMHNVMADARLIHDRPIYDLETTVHRPLALLKNRFSELQEEYAYLQYLQKRIEDYWARTDTSGFSYGYCHYDLLAKNFHFDAQNNLTFFDFDWLGQGFLVNDLMTFQVQYFFLTNLNMIGKEDSIQNFKLFVKSYREVRYITNAELAAIPYLGLMFWIYALGFFEENSQDYAANFFTAQFIKGRIADIKKWEAWFCPQ